MSGIHGILRFDRAAVSARDLERQARAMAHRGKDRANLWREGAAGLGHLLNQVTTEDYFERQPVCEAGIALTADLRLDNREDLAAALDIAPGALAEVPDSVLLLKAYLRWGEDCAAHLLGDFAFAIWDGPARKLVLGRDHVGQRHVFYHRGPAFFAFASEPGGLWALADVPRKLADNFVGARMIMAPRPGGGATQFEEVFAVEGGTVMTVGADGAAAVRRYWTPGPAPEHVGRDEAYYIEAYRRVLADAVACRVRRTVRPAGLMLGGGFDSGSIAALAGPAVTVQRRKLVAVSSVMPEGDTTTPRNARRWVNYLARDLPHLDLRYVTREGADIFTGMSQDFLATDGLRGPDRYAVDLVMRALAASGVRAIMDGNGGDYTLNPRARRAPLRLLLRHGVRAFLPEFRAYRATTGIGYPRLVLREIVLPLLPNWLVAPFDRLRHGLAPFSAAPMPVAESFLRKMDLAGLKRRAFRPDDRFADRGDTLPRVIERLQSSPVMGGALHAAIHGLELTLPFHDKRVVELALAIPDRLIFKNGRDRYLARKALADVLPKELLRRGNINDDMTPDFCAMIRRVEPAILADIARMEKEGRMARYFDLPRMRNMLTGRYGPWRSRRTDAAIHHAARSFLHARYIEWFQRDNYAGDDKP